MDPATLRAHLASLCADIDAGRRTVQAVKWAGAALVATGTMTACFDKEEPVPLYGATFDSGSFEQACDDADDNDDDGLTDCDDPDCADDPACEAVDEYGAPAAEDDCEDEIDNDHDGMIDCDDMDCADDPACASAGLYAAPSD